MSVIEIEMLLSHSQTELDPPLPFVIGTPTYILRILVQFVGELPMPHLGLHVYFMAKSTMSIIWLHAQSEHEVK